MEKVNPETYFKSTRISKLLMFIYWSSSIFFVYPLMSYLFDNKTSFDHFMISAIVAFFLSFYMYTINVLRDLKDHIKTLYNKINNMQN